MKFCKLSGLLGFWSDLKPTMGQH